MRRVPGRAEGGARDLTQVPVTRRETKRRRARSARRNSRVVLVVCLCTDDDEKKKKTIRLPAALRPNDDTLVWERKRPRTRRLVFRRSLGLGAHATRAKVWAARHARADACGAFLRTRLTRPRGRSSPRGGRTGTRGASRTWTDILKWRTKRSSSRWSRTTRQCLSRPPRRPPTAPDPPRTCPSSGRARRSRGGRSRLGPTDAGACDRTPRSARRRI